MCGVAGTFAYAGGAAPVDRAALLRVREAMANRGPDGAGAWWSADGRVGLAHRRLAIIDPDPRSAQPFLAGDLALVFNGEIYNYRALRRELEALGLTFVTQGDTEVLLAAYLAWGRDLFPRLRGMYAFALWDGRRGGMLLGRDPYGIKPIYYADDGGTLRFASQVKALAAGCHLGAPDPAGLVGFLLTGSVPEPHTLWSGVRALPAGQALWVDGQGPGRPWAHACVPEVWAGAVAAAMTTATDGAETIGAALRDSVRHHQIADVPVGAFLSAGIDSGALVGLMRESVAEVQTLTLGFSEFRGTPRDETPWAERTAAHLGTHHSTVWITAQEAVRDLPLVLGAMDQPSVDGVNTWLVSRAAHEAGLKVAVSGLGGDELFGGYTTFAGLGPWRTWQGRLDLIPGARALASALLGALAQARWVHSKVPALLALGGSDAAYYLVRRGLFMPWELPALLDTDLVRAGLAALQPPAFLTTGASLPADAFAAMASLEATNYLRNQLLRDSDWASMAHGLELRLPLVDYALLQSTAPLILGARAKGVLRSGPKDILAQSPTLGLPAGLAQRPKTGFGIPMDSWLMACEALGAWRRHPLLSGPRVHWSRRLAYALVDDALGGRDPGLAVRGAGR